MPTLVSVETGTPIHVRLTKNADYLIITDKNGVELGKWYAGGNKLVVQNIPDTTKECGKQS